MKENFTKTQIKRIGRAAISAIVNYAPARARAAIIDALMDHFETEISARMNRAPARARAAIFDALMDNFEAEVSTRLFSRFGIVEIGAWGNLGLIRSAWNDRLVLRTYALAGDIEARIVSEIMEYFGDAPGTYIDIGANIGLTTIPFAKKQSVRCLAFEPEPVNYRFLKLNVEANVPNNTVEFHQCAVLHTDTTVSLAIADGNLGDHRVTKSGIPGRRTIEVPAIPLDNVLDRIKGKLAVKVDTQGAEPYVIVGGGQVLRRAGLIAVEFCPYLMRQLEGDPEIVIDVIGDFDEVALIDPHLNTKPVFATPPEAQSVLRAKLRSAKDSDGDYLDILARRKLIE